MDFRRAVATHAVGGSRRPSRHRLSRCRHRRAARQRRRAAGASAATTVKQTDPRSRSRAPEPPLRAGVRADRRRCRRRCRRRRPTSNSNGKFSLSRQLGLGVSRVVIDAGHGGHDPGAHGNGVTESELTLDVALRAAEAAAGAARHRSRDDARHRRLHPPRGTDRDREPRRSGPLPLDPRQRQPQPAGPRDRDLLPQLRDEPGGGGGRRARERDLGAGDAQPARHREAPSPSNNKINESRDLAATVQKSMAKRLSTKNRSLQGSRGRSRRPSSS